MIELDIKISRKQFGWILKLEYIVEDSGNTV